MRVSMCFLVLLLAPGLSAATIRGDVLVCRALLSAAGHVVKAFEAVELGVPTPGGLCIVSTPDPRLVGTATLEEDGSFNFDYTPFAENPRLCSFEAKVFVQVFLPDGTLVLESDREVRKEIVEFQHISERIIGDCPDPRTKLSVTGPSVVSGEPGEIVSFEASIILDTSFRGRQGVVGANVWFTFVKADGGTITAATLDGTAAASTEDVPPGLRSPSDSLDILVVGFPVDNSLPLCFGGPMVESVIALDLGDPRVGLPLEGPPRPILRVTVEAVIPAQGAARTCRVSCPNGCGVKGGSPPIPQNNTATVGRSALADVSEFVDLEVLLTASAAPASTFRRADANASGKVDISDAVATFGFLFLGDKPPSCMDAADSNGDGIVDISDGVNTLTYLFGGGKTIPSPGPDACGPGGAGQADCASYDRC